MRCSDISFGPRPFLTSDGGPGPVAVADLNGDGRSDFVLAERLRGGLLVGLGAPDGGFQLFPMPAQGVSPSAVVLARVTGSPSPSLIFSDDARATVSVMLGNGDGTFKTAAMYPVLAAPSALAVADFSGDDIADIAVASADAGAVIIVGGFADGGFQVVQQLGDGGWPAGALLAEPGVAITQLATVDFNSDGRPDLIIAGTIGGIANLSLRLSGCDAGFCREMNLADGGTYPVLQTGDLDGDGRPDIVFANQSATIIFYANGQTGAVSFTDTSGLVIGDLDGDGHADLVGTSEDGGLATVCFGLGDGGLGPCSSFGIEATPSDVAIGDWNGDGRSDLLTIDRSTGGLIALSGLRNRTLEHARLDYPILAATSVAVADLDHDGRPDVAVCGFNVMDILLGQGDATLVPSFSIGAQVSPFLVRIADFNVDGNPDLAVMSDYAGVVGLFLGFGDGGLAPPSATAVQTDPIDFTIADFNGDGIPDFASVQNYLELFLGTGDGGFAQPWQAYLPLDGASIDHGDFNADGLQDLLVGQDGGVTVWLGIDGGAFQPGPQLLARGELKHLAVGDFDRDGRLDFAAVGSSPPTVSIQFGNGDGTFTRSVEYPLPATADSVTPFDANGDGILDLAITLPASSGILIMQGRPDGGFAAVPRTPALMQNRFGRGTLHLAVGDLDGDGRIDLVVGSGRSTVSVIPNTCR